ncbi:hypothetical protein FISHEDRAFT_70547 [Fistulina hepatica ATCC 64428]|uniref:Uncharacterized protein n=1 Tax=Fistulina hepatica ATCC 64428 TaxID=1128425 RepID=A0A0D7AJT4_9AGAR|nr:hypothetical protein FISHEDRAFT_70547 [Fistulina hepatica ATCC 64428]
MAHPYKRPMTSTNVRGRTLCARSAESAESEPVQFLPEKKRRPRPRKDSHPISEATAEPATTSAQDPVTEAREALRISTSLSTAADFVTSSPSGTTAEGPQGDKDLASPTTPRKLAGWSPRTEEEPHAPGGGSSEDDVPTPLYSTMSPECSVTTPGKHNPYGWCIVTGHTICSRQQAFFIYKNCTY